MVRILEGIVVNTSQSAMASLSCLEQALASVSLLWSLLFSIRLLNSIVASALQTESEEARARHLARLDEESRRVRALIVPHRRTSMAYTRIRGRSRATTSRAAAQVDNLGVPSVREQEVIDRLSGGEGCSGSELRSLIELCTSCHRYFIASLLKVHIRGCAPDV